MLKISQTASSSSSLHIPTLCLPSTAPISLFLYAGMHPSHDIHPRMTLISCIPRNIPSTRPIYPQTRLILLPLASPASSVPPRPALLTADSSHNPPPPSEPPPSPPLSHSTPRTPPPPPRPHPS